MMGLLRYQIFLTYGVVFLSLWYYALQNRGQSKTEVVLVDFAPVWAVILLGLYLLARLIVGVATYTDCPEAAAELDRQVVEAKAEMKRRKIIK